MWPFKNDPPKEKSAADATRPAQQPRALSFVPPEVIKQIGGLPTVAVYGFMHGEVLGAGQFQPNPPFLNFLHDVIRHHVPNDPAMQSGARQQRNGSLSIVDLRTPEGPQGRVPPEDVIGIFEIKDGAIRPGYYFPNDKYVVFAPGKGPTRLPPNLLAAFVSELKKLCTPKPPISDDSRYMPKG